MSKKKVYSKKPVAGRKPRKPLKRLCSQRNLTILVCLLLALTLAGGILAQWRPGFLTKGIYPALAPAPAVPPATSPSKEYIYADGRLIATEEPSVAPSSGPTHLAATAAANATQVNLTWDAPNIAVHHYRVERAETAGNFNASFDSPTNSFTDSAASNKAYLYRVCGVDAGGAQLTVYSNVDLATTVIFTDDPLIAHSPSQPGTTIKAEHLVQLRQAVNAVRVLAGFGAASWTYANPVSFPVEQRRPIYWEDIKELRDGLDQALNALGRWEPYVTDPQLTRGMIVRANHFQELRQRVK
jgi:hypothetical protein